MQIKAFMSVRGKQNNDMCFCLERSQLFHGAATKSDPAHVKPLRSPTIMAACPKRENMNENRKKYFQQRWNGAQNEHCVSANDLFLSVCFQSSDGEVRRLSEQLSQRAEEVHKLQKDREHLVELSQVRATQGLWRFTVGYSCQGCSDSKNKSEKYKITWVCFKQTLCQAPPLNP